MDKESVDTVKIRALISALQRYNTAASKFIAKVDSGYARSRETYKDLSEARNIALDVLKDFGG